MRVVPSVTAVNSSGATLEALAQLFNPLDIMSDMEKRFVSWIADELKVTGLAVNGSAVEPPSWILEDILNGGISLRSKDTHGLPVVAWGLGPAAAWIG